MSFPVKKVETARADDIGEIKALADLTKKELGFVNRAWLVRSIDRGQVLLIRNRSRIVGFLEYHHRRDKQTTIYHIVIEEKSRGMGYGLALFSELVRESVQKDKEFIQIKCPAELPANEFYHNIGCKRVGKVDGIKRELLIWEFPLVGQ